MTKQEKIGKVKQTLDSAISSRREREALAAAMTLDERESLRYGLSRSASDEFRALCTEGIRQCKLNEAKVARLIRKVGPSYRQLLSAHYIDGHTWAEIAEDLNYSETHIHRLHRAALEALAGI